ncbi:MAG: SLC13 family permease, partial [Candidatus Eremiobacteraeota bacterium]|nr:SLC13 family permease [Candidatus Eremiobacteraeota bacterium]
MCAATVLAIIVRPKQIHETIWAGLGAVALVALGLVSVRGAAEAIMSGRNVYLFLIGMMLLAEVARRERIFDWFAARALHHANRSRSKLFNLLFAVGIIVTALLSNDATAIVLTPAVYTVITLI